MRFIQIKRDKAHVKGGGTLPPPSDMSFIKTGCTGLDLVLGGGWVLGRIANVVGDKSTGKTLLAIEAAANFARDYPKGKIWYRESESAFNKSYAASLGMPVDRVKFGKSKFDTVEDFYEDLMKQTEWLKDNKREGLYILDSLDALSDRKELERDIDKGSYGADKAKQLSQLFRKLVRKIEASKMCVIIISQVRDKIGLTFGRKTTRSGGRALDFYASHVVYLSHIKTLKKTRSGEKRAVGVRIRAHCDKNKVSVPFREFEFPIRFGYGVEDLAANVEYLNSTGRLKKAGLDKRAFKRARKGTEELSRAEYEILLAKSRKALTRAWNGVEDSFKPEWSKYG